MKTAGKSHLPLLAILAIIALAAGYLVGGKVLQPDRSAAAGATSDMAGVGDRRPDFSLPDLQGRSRGIAEWDGKVVLVNFWATWCPPCRKEMPGFIELREQYRDQGFEIIGIAIDEKTAVGNFVDGMGVSYPVLHGQADASEVTRRYGNRLGALPFSVLLDRDGVIRATRAGEWRKDDLEAALKQYL